MRVEFAIQVGNIAQVTIYIHAQGDVIIVTRSYHTDTTSGIFARKLIGMH